MEIGIKQKNVDERDSYERADQYNTIGMSVLFALKLNSCFVLDQSNGATLLKGWNIP